MDVTILLSVISSIICIILMIGLFTAIILMIRNMKNANMINKFDNDMDLGKRKLELEKMKAQISYTNEILEFARMMVSEVSLLKFQEFKDGRDMTKITKVNIEHLIEDIARTVNESIALENIPIGDILITSDYFNKYIVETSIYTIKKMLNDTIDVDGFNLI